MTININVADKRATVIGAPVIVCGNSDYSVRFTFDEAWADLEYKTARFVYVKDGAVHHTDVPFTGDTVAVPMLSNTKEVFVGVFSGSLYATTPARIPCELSILCGTGEPQDPVPDVPDDPEPEEPSEPALRVHFSTSSSTISTITLFVDDSEVYRCGHEDGGGLTGDYTFECDSMPSSARIEVTQTGSEAYIFVGPNWSDLISGWYCQGDSIDLLSLGYTDIYIALEY